MITIEKALFLRTFYLLRVSFCNRDWVIYPSKVWYCIHVYFSPYYYYTIKWRKTEDANPTAYTAHILAG